MSILVKSVYRLKLYAIFLSITLFISCEKWNLPTVSDSLTYGLIAYYPFNGNPLDESGNGLHGQLMNGATYGPDRKETNQSALFLDGINDYLEIPDNNKLRPDSISISLWIKMRAVTESNHIYDKSNFSTHENQQYSAFIRPPRPPNTSTACCEIITDVNTDGLCTIEQPIQNPVIYYEPTYAMNQWYHIVTVFAGQTHKLYINGVLKMSQRELATNPIDRCAGGNLRFGAQTLFADDPNYFNGTMDEIRIYNRSLSQAEINALYKR